MRADFHPVPLVEMVYQLELKGYEVMPIPRGKQFVFWILKEGNVIKQGEKLYKTWKQGEIEVYTKLYKIINQ